MMEPSPAEPSYLPWDTSRGVRFARYTPDDHSASLWVAALLGMVYTVCVLMLRAYIKRRVFGWDDYLITASSIVALGQFVVIFVALRAGLGKVPANVPDLDLVGELIFSSRILCLISLYLAKISVLAILSRIFLRDQPGLKLICSLVFGFTVLSSVVSIFLSSVGCSPSGFSTDKHCTRQFELTRWSIITGLDVSTEAMMILLPPYMLFYLQMRVQNKLRVIAAFCFRLSIIVLSALHLQSLITYTNGPSSPFLIIRTLVWQQIVLAVALITATIPNLKAFLQSLSARWGEEDMTTYGNYGTGTYELKNMNSKAVAKSGIEGHFLGVAIESEVTRRNSLESLSGGSQDMIIRKETTWSVVRT